MHKHIAGLPILVLFAVGCDPGTAPTLEFDSGPGLAPTEPAMHEVIVDGVDLCALAGAGTECGAVFSLHATQHMDGTVEGEWRDVWQLDPRAPINVEVDCLSVEGNMAWVGGVVTQPSVYAGMAAITLVRDGPDQISYTQDAAGRTCRDQPDLSLVYVHTDRVTVR